jgi:peptidoglycan/xylan/chitin deacetylase (PgdA/CDA1 family)
MSPPRTAQYHSLAPFRNYFKNGTPILIYHKIGRRPPRTRLKGLYTAPKRFQTQLAELRRAGFQTPKLMEIIGGQAGGGKIVLSFDDGFRNVFENALAPLAEHRFRAIQFLVADLIGQRNEWDVPVGEAPEPLMDAAQIREWVKAGHEIGSHSLTHPHLTQLTPAAAKNEILTSKKKLEDTFGVAIKHFCFPYGDWNERVAAWVEEAGYASACTTNFGLVQPSSRPYALNRIAVRYPSRSLKTLGHWLARQMTRRD